MIAWRTSGAPWPALVTSTPLLKSSQRLPYLSNTNTSSARSHTNGGWPRMDCGSNWRSFSSVGSESGCGSLEMIRRYLVSTRGTARGVILNSLPISYGHRRTRVSTNEKTEMEALPRNANLGPRNDKRTLRNDKRKLCLLPSLRPVLDKIARRYGISRQPRSEEHTSELQSLRHLVCRLLL